MKKAQNFWFGKRVLVTGGDGFLAAHLIKELLSKKAVVVTTVRHNRPLKTLDLLNRPNCVSQPDVEHSNLLNYQEVRRMCDRHQIDTIFHLAATVIVSEAANSPMSTIENNIITSLNLLEVARVNEIPRIIVASSDKSYGDHADNSQERLPYKESYALRGLDIYSASKVCADMIAQTYAFQFGLPVAVTRSCNIYGPGDLNFTRLIPRTVMSILAGKSPVINVGNEKVLREYIYVEDVVRADLLIAENIGKYYGPNNKNMPKGGVLAYGWPTFNVGSYTKEESKNLLKCDKIKDVSSVIEIIGKKMGYIKPVIIPKPSNFIEIPDQYLDSSKIRTLGFKPLISFEEGLKRTISWYKKNAKLTEKNAFRYIHN